jgi:hypothetical protein
MEDDDPGESSDRWQQRSPFDWVLFAAAGGVLGWLCLGSLMRGPGDPTGVIVGPVFGAFIGLGIGVIWRAIHPPGRRRLSFSLRTLFVGVTLAALVMPFAIAKYRELQSRRHFGKWAKSIGARAATPGERAPYDD